MPRTRALVLGGTGHLGSAVATRLAAGGLPTAFTWHHSKDKAKALEATGLRGLRIDLRDSTATREGLGRLAGEWGDPDVLVHCAGVAPSQPLAQIDDGAWDFVQALNVRAAFVACRALAPAMVRGGGGDIVFALALDGAHPVPAPAHFAASQAALLGLMHALAKELGPQGVRVNAVKLGVLEGGISAGLAGKLREDFLKFSALRRLGSAEEAARAIAWLALGSGYLNGAVLPVCGGL